MEAVNTSIVNFKGDLRDLEKAIGTFAVGRELGWKPLMLIHDKRTLKKYEKILSLDMKEDLPEVGEHAEKSYAWKAVLKLGGFWNAVKGLKKGIRSPITAD